MFKKPEYENNISLKLSEVLDDIGINERMVKKRRRVYMLGETITTINNQLTVNNQTVYFAGSRTEGATTKGLVSDFDILHCNHYFNVMQDWSEWKPGKENLLMIKNETTTPGYCFLQRLRSDLPLHITEINKHSIRDRNGRILLKNTVLNVYQVGVQERHGPSYFTPGKLGKPDIDYVIAYPCTSWPQSAKGWIERQGIGNWPTPYMKRYAVSNGCFVVGVVSKVSAYTDMEWRISTSLAERCLMYNLNITQLRCYVLMKMLVKTSLNPLGENNMSSFMCKTVLLHCIENTETNTWQEHNLLMCLTYCLLELSSCVRSDHSDCPHFIIPENNLMAGQFSAEVKHLLLERISGLIQSDVNALLSVHIDNLGLRLQIKLNIVPHYVTYNLPSPAEICELVSAEFYINLAISTSYSSNLILRVKDNKTEVIKLQLKRIINYSKQGNRLEKAACRFLAPLLYTKLGSILASSNIGQNNMVSPVALTCLSAGLNSDVASSRLTLASVFYCIGDMEKTEFILRNTKQQCNSGVVVPVCDCWEHPAPDVSAEFKKICNEQNEKCIKYITTFCIRFLRCEINCVPSELKYEMFRSTHDDMLHRDQDKDCWMDCAVADPLPYLYFLQYKTYGHLQRYPHQQQALSNLMRTIDTDPNLRHKETALNLLGQCMEQENRSQQALKCYMLSLNERARNNAAKFHICRLLSNAMLNR
ncbi:uncharacterized protein LOC123540445 [Mercenaria mercenaria]|uniref:uncharacterized protein LOC123540445 n=1 Tax=Mercenaria mercenaria TaxID=6596 RepID=UPI00234E5ABA|nr:uncharacterized protein LOC123540445 [Mercenaria mercenaria]